MTSAPEIVARVPPKPVPDPRLRGVRNLTPFAHFQADKMAPGRRFFDTVVVKGAFELRPGVLAIADQQTGVVFADEPFDATLGARSSLRRVGELVLGKPGTDVFVTGTARSPGDKPAPSWDTGVVVNEASGKKVVGSALRVTGPRRFVHRGVRGWTVTDAEPASAVDVRYELAYGGAYLDPESDDGEYKLYEPNPAGTGFFDVARLDKERTYPAPQWLDHGEPASAMNVATPLAGFGPVPRPWSSRLRYAGTYDAAWERRAREDAALGLPIDYPADFDARFFQCAPPALISARHLRGDEQLGLVGLVAAHPRLVANLPGLRVRARLLRGKDALTTIDVPLDTVHVDLDAAKVYLVWRLSLDQRSGVRAAALSTEPLA